MSKYLKKLLWVAVLIVIITGAYLAYRYFFGSKPATTPQNGGAAATALIPTKEISTLPIFDYWINKNSGDIYYIAQDSQLHKITGDGKDIELDSKAIGNLGYIKPSNDGTLILVAFGYPQNPTFAIYDTAQKSWQAFPAGTTAAAWDPKSNNRLAYLKNNGSTARLYLFTINTNRSVEILRLAEQDLNLDWSQPNIIYFMERPSGKYLSSVWAYNLTTKSFTALIRNESSLLWKWRNDNTSAIKWSNGALSLVDGQNRVLGTTDLKTLPEKCAFADLRIYCAASGNQASVIPSSFADDYLKKLISSDDDFYFLSLLDLGKNTNLIKIPFFSSLEIGNKIDADHLEIQNNRLLFINRHDEKLYSLEL